MKKAVMLLVLFIFCILSLTACRLRTYEEISVVEEQYKEIDETGVKNIDFTDCTVDYVSDSYFYIFVYERMSSANVNELIKCIQNASLEKTDDFVSVDGGGEAKFRITLNNEEVIYIGYDECNNPDIIGINGIPFKCDEESIKNIKGKIRNYRKQPNGLWYYQ